MKYCIILSYPDRSGIMGVFSSWETEELAEQGIEWLSHLPGMETCGGMWEVFPIRNLSEDEDG